MKKLMFKLMMLALTLGLSFNTFAQSLEVSGKVLDDQKIGIPGASVVIKGTTNGMATDIDGNFTIKVEKGQTLIVSFVGFKKKEVVMDGTSPLEIILENEAIGLNEVVAIGYGKQRRKDVTSSITSVKAEDMAKGVVSDAAQMLQGKVPGLSITRDGSPGGGVSSIVLRGASTLRGAASPLFVVDGIPGASMPAAEDIESMDILRDASATAIYGSRAANGVIMITTKKGDSEKTSITYHTYLAIDQVANKYNMMSADQYRDFLKKNGQTLSPESELGANTNWQDEVLRTGIAQNHHFSITGGGKNTNYNASISYMDHKGIIKTSEMNRVKTRFYIKHTTLDDRLDLSFNFMNNVSNSSSGIVNINDGKSVFSGMMYYLPTVPVKNQDGSYYENSRISRNYNPVALLNQFNEDQKTKEMMGSVKASLNIMEGLDYDVTFSMKDVQVNKGSYTMRDALLIEGKNGVASRSAFEDTRSNLEMYLNYGTKFGQHDLKGMVGYSWEESKFSDGLSASSYNFANDELGYYNLNLGNPGSGYLPDFGGGKMKKLRMISFFGRFNYNYASRYLFQATVRRDGSSAFGHNNQWGTFPSFSGAWRLAEEGFIKDLGLFDDLKMRVGYGVSGNSAGFDPTISLLKYTKSGTYYKEGELVPAIGPVQNPNPDLKWERTSMLNAGIDFAFFNNRLSGTFEWYKKNTTDLIWKYPVSTTKYLVGSMIANVGEIDNKGFEFTLNATPIHHKDWKWTTTLNLSHNSNEVVSLSNDEFSVDYIWTAELNGGGQSGNKQQIIEEGKPIGQFYLWKWLGYNEDGVSIYEDKDGNPTTNPTSEDKFYGGNAQPDLVYGWDNNISYKNFSLNIFFRGVTGNDVLNASYAKLNNFSQATSFNQLADEADAPFTDINSHYYSTRYLENGSYLRLENLALSYDMNVKSKYIKNLKVYCSCNNVFTITAYKGIDPEVSLGGLTPGIDHNNFYPKARTFMFGINVTL
ncbi:TonB-dependent receptor [Prolixibacteraceae bacterium JC049]|nr:TonB-dependent receptor [Prolixibacteraceae bacterium JC049]